MSLENRFQKQRPSDSLSNDDRGNVARLPDFHLDFDCSAQYVAACVILHVSAYVAIYTRKQTSAGENRGPLCIGWGLNG